MACSPTPTLTEFELATTSSITTSYENSLTTIPPDVLTTVTSTCLLSSVDVVNRTTVCLSSTTVEVVSTQDEGEVDTVQVPVVLTIPVTVSRPTATRFAPCTTDGSDPADPSSPPSPPPPPPSPPPSPPPPPPPPPPSSITYPSGPVYVSMSTPLPSVFVSQVTSTASDGAVLVTYMTFTSTQPPTPVYIPTSLVPTSSSQARKNTNVSNDLGPIIGGSLGGFFGMIGVVAIFWFIWRKRESLRKRYAGAHWPEYDPSSHSPRQHRVRYASPPPGFEPKPYEYGLVGRPPSTPTHSSPPTSPPPTRPQSFSALSNMNPYTPSAGVPLQNPSTPNLLHTTSPVAPPRPITPMTPLSPPYLNHHRGPTGSEASVGTAVSYPFPVLPREDDAHASEGAEESVSDRRQTRLSLTLANWNPETDGELFARASSDDGRSSSVREPRPSGPG